MAGEEPVSGRRPLNPLPIALYESFGLIFELYQGGQPYRRTAIIWERLKPIDHTRLPEAPVQPKRDRTAPRVQSTDCPQKTSGHSEHTNRIEEGEQT